MVPLPTFTAELVPVGYHPSGHALVYAINLTFSEPVVFSVAHACSAAPSTCFTVTVDGAAATHTPLNRSIDEPGHLVDLTVAQQSGGSQGLRAANSTRRGLGVRALRRQASSHAPPSGAVLGFSLRLILSFASLPTGLEPVTVRVAPRAVRNSAGGYAEDVEVPCGVLEPAVIVTPPPPAPVSSSSPPPTPLAASPLPPGSTGTSVDGNALSGQGGGGGVGLIGAILAAALLCICLVSILMARQRRVRRLRELVMAAEQFESLLTTSDEGGTAGGGAVVDRKLATVASALALSSTEDRPLTEAAEEVLRTGSVLPAALSDALGDEFERRHGIRDGAS